ncbi:MAG: hypothetical protein LW700_03745 [Gemmataceae bacterium]|jgi:hypothetical protein|nr:hypothetical protein [Gemmataceae bacterium]
MWQSIFWHIPALVIPVSLVYGATRFENPGEIIGEAIQWIRRLVVFLTTIAIVVHLLTWLV